MLDSILSAAEPTFTPTTPNSQDVTAALDVVTERGDIILQLGKDDEPLNLLVSSVALGLASPVFEAMFDGRFAEGQSLSTNSPQTIPLPDDNPECVAMLCMIVHMRTEQLPKSLSATKLADFAVVCDKYCCISAVQAWARIWTAEYLSNSNSEDFEKILFANICAWPSKGIQASHPEYYSRSHKSSQHQRSHTCPQFPPNRAL